MTSEVSLGRLVHIVNSVRSQNLLKNIINYTYTQIEYNLDNTLNYFCGQMSTSTVKYSTVKYFTVNYGNLNLCCVEANFFSHES